jgi:hypothetical protein
MAPETHTRYRVQRLIRLGEWLERNQDALVLAFEVINEAHDTLIDPPEDMPASDIVEEVGFQQLHAVTTLRTIVNDLRFDVPTRNVKRGVDVTLHHPFACESKQYEVVIKAPKAQGIPTQQQYNLEEQERLKAEYDAAQAEPTQEEFDKVRSEVDITA